MQLLISTLRAEARVHRLSKLVEVNPVEKPEAVRARSRTRSCPRMSASNVSTLIEGFKRSLDGFEGLPQDVREDKLYLVL